MTDLPHHVSEQSEIASLIGKMELLQTHLYAKTCNNSKVSQYHAGLHTEIHARGGQL